MGVFLKLSGVMHPELVFPPSLLVTEQTIDISGFSATQKAFYLDLFWQIIGRYQQAQRARFTVGFTGPTGAGKSVIAVLFKELARQARLPFAFESITIDAYHYPNDYLLAHFSDGQSLKQVKGRYDTYEVAALARDLGAFAAGGPVAFPAYSRKLHNPVPNAVQISTGSALLIVEGLWLQYDQSGWESIAPLLDVRFFIEADQERTRQAVIRRHMTGGRSLADATRHYEQVDGKNSALVLQTKARADQVLPPYYLI